MRFSDVSPLNHENNNHNTNKTYFKWKRVKNLYEDWSTKFGGSTQSLKKNIGTPKSTNQNENFPKNITFIYSVP
jgi:hypothetical protein